MYARAFMWIVSKCNETLDVKTVKRAYFIGVLDIAGFETFEENGFEQLCINFTNERLQQYFNNFMFVLEQEEYAKEGIVWEMMSFGADLQATIDLIDKPMGIFSMLEEECVVPKGTDMTYKDKMYAKHLGKHPSFGKPKPSKSKYEAHFELKHYAGVVAYGVNGWLEKNKDPINEFVAAMFKSQDKNKLLSFLFQDIGVEQGGPGGKKGSQTISANHREQLNKLMKTLGATHPHFVRCIIPNEIKTGGIIDAHLVMHQLHCNGVLEGIRICRKGFPSRIIFVEFIQRYSILDPATCKGIAGDKDKCKKATDTILKKVKMDPELYRIGLTKVLFKAGVLGTLEEHRDAAISGYLVALQSQIRCYLMKKNIQKMIEAKKAISTAQKNCRAYNVLKNWNWWKLMTFVKPLLQNAKKEV
jgi:myosin heavy subunit